MQTSTLRPGLLVSLKTSVAGNVQYHKVTVEADHVTETGERRARWETERTIADPDEHEKAIKLRSAARALVTRECSASAFGYLCPESASETLSAAVLAAHAMVDAFNATAAMSRVSLYVITGRVAADDVEAVRAINSEVRDLIAAMESGARNLDVKVIREAAGKAKSIGAMLSPDAQARVTVAVEAARDVARRIVKAGDQAAAEVDQRVLQTLAESRTAFLDLGDAGEIAAPAETARALDLAPAEDHASAV